MAQSTVSPEESEAECADSAATIVATSRTETAPSTGDTANTVASVSQTITTNQETHSQSGNASAQATPDPVNTVAQQSVASVGDVTAADNQTIVRGQSDIPEEPSQRPTTLPIVPDHTQHAAASEDNIQKEATEGESHVEEAKEVIGTAVIIEKDDNSAPPTPQTPSQSTSSNRVSSSPAISVGSGSPLPAFIPILTSPPRPRSLVGSNNTRSTPRLAIQKDSSHPPCVPATPNTPPAPVSLNQQLSVSTVGSEDSSAPTPVPASAPASPESGNLNLRLSVSPGSSGPRTSPAPSTVQPGSAIDNYPNGPPSNQSDVTVAYEDPDAPSPFSPMSGLTSPNGSFQSPRKSLSRSGSKPSSSDVSPSTLTSNAQQSLGSPNILATPLPRQVEDPVHAPSPMPSSQSSSAQMDDLDDEELENINANVFQRPSRTSSGRRKAGSSPKTPSIRQRPDPVHMPTPMHSATNSPAKPRESSTMLVDVVTAAARAREERSVGSPMVGSPSSPYLSMTPSPENLPNPLESMTEEELAERERQKQLEESGRQRVQREYER